jgi:integrase
VDALFDVIRTPRDRAIFRLVYHRGLRSSEPGLLQLSDWNERDGLLHVRRGKNSISRDHRLVAVEAQALRAWIRIRGREPGPLFPSRQRRAGGFGIHRNQLDRLFRRYCADAGIRPEKAHMHALKHSCGTHLAERGNSADEIQDWLGHRAAKSTQVYMHFSDRRRAAAWERNRDWR